jgi:hypothetical protein
MKTSKPMLFVHHRPAIAFRSLKILALNENSQLNIYLRYPDGSRRYLMSHRWNSYLWALLKEDGVYISDLFRIQPKRCRHHPNLYDTVQYLLKVIDSYFAHEMAA